MKKVTKIELDYSELDSLIEREFNMRQGSYESVAQNEWNNYSCYEFDVKAVEISAEHLAEVERAAAETNTPEAAKKWKLFRVDNYTGTDDLLNHLCAQGKIEAGEYLVTVYW